MSHTAQVCLKYYGSLDALKIEVERVLGIELRQYDTGGPMLRAFYGKCLTMDVELSTNPFDSDRTLNYADFPYVVSTRVAGQACSDQLLKLQVPLTDVIGVLLSHYLQIEVMVTLETQELLARYKFSDESR
jgi:hypothetical protein